MVTPSPTPSEQVCYILTNCVLLTYNFPGAVGPVLRNGPDSVVGDLITLDLIINATVTATRIDTMIRINTAKTIGSLFLRNFKISIVYSSQVEMKLLMSLDNRMVYIQK